MSNIGKVVEMTNIDNEDFTHSYGGSPFTVRSGETITFPFDVGVHLAKHLARKILIRNDKGSTVWNQSDTTSNSGNGTPIWTQESEQTMIKKILGESFIVETIAEKSEIEKLKDEIEKLNDFRKQFDVKQNVESDKVLNRGELLKRGKELGIKVSLSMSNDELRSSIAEVENVKLEQLEQ
jgi:hypothetical protein